MALCTVVCRGARLLPLLILSCTAIASASQGHQTIPAISWPSNLTDFLAWTDAEAALDVLQSNQAPQDCANARYLILDDVDPFQGNGAGWGWSFWLLSTWLIQAALERRVLVFAASAFPDDPAFHWRWCERTPRSFECYFEPWSHCEQWLRHRPLSLHQTSYRRQEVAKLSSRIPYTSFTAIISGLVGGTKGHASTEGQAAQAVRGTSGAAEVVVGWTPKSGAGSERYVLLRGRTAHRTASSAQGGTTAGSTAAAAEASGVMKNLRHSVAAILKGHWSGAVTKGKKRKDSQGTKGQDAQLTKGKDMQRSTGQAAQRLKGNGAKKPTEKHTQRLHGGDARQLKLKDTQRPANDASAAEGDSGDRAVATTQQGGVSFGAEGTRGSGRGLLWWLALASRIMIKPQAALTREVDGFLAAHGALEAPFIAVHVRRGNESSDPTPLRYYKVAMTRVAKCFGARHFLLITESPSVVFHLQRWARSNRYARLNYTLFFTENDRYDADVWNPKLFGGRHVDMHAEGRTAVLNLVASRNAVALIGALQSSWAKVTAAYMYSQHLDRPPPILSVSNGWEVGALYYGDERRWLVVGPQGNLDWGCPGRV